MTVPVAGDLFAIALLNAAIIGAAAVTLAISYAFGDVFRRPHSLHHGLGKADLFHGSYALMVALAAGIVLIPGAPLGTITIAVQALAGVLLPSATVFLLLLCNDKAVLGPWTNPGWPRVPRVPRVVREHWTMPQLELLDRPVWSRTRKAGMLTLRGYLVIAVLMLIVKAIEVGIGH
jgi:Mn2+/Fe2+ NRAMP family transporter